MFGELGLESGDFTRDPIGLLFGRGAAVDTSGRGKLGEYFLETSGETFVDEQGLSE